MNNSHPSFIKPDEDTVIWHYMDFTKYVSLLEKRALFFSTIGMLRETDEHEGTYNPATVETSKQKPFSIHDIGSGMLRTFGKLLAVNCWHMNENESVAMWNIYLKGNPGIAIQSTFRNLEITLNSNPTQQSIPIGKVHYLAEDDVIPEPDGFNGLNAVLWKWKSYQYENELRAVVISRLEELFEYNGIYIPVDLHQLIQRVVISPKAPKWFSELIFAISAKYDLGERVVSSRLDIRPGTIDNNGFSIDFTCPLCSTTQEIAIEPFIVKDYPNNSTIVFSADRVTIQCRNCLHSLIFRVRPEIKDLDADAAQSETS